MSPRKVKYVRFHSGLFVGGSVGDIGECLPAKNKTIPGLAMFWDGTALYFNVGALEYAVPSANVKILEFEPEEPKPPKKAA